MKKNLTLDEMIRYAQESAADGGYVEVPGAEILPLLLELRDGRGVIQEAHALAEAARAATAEVVPLLGELLAARAFIDAAQELSMDLGEIQFCPICDGDCAESHTDDCTFAKSEALLNAYVKVVQK